MSVDGEDLESALSWIRLLLQEPRLDDEGVASSVDDLERRKRRGRTRDSMIASAVSRSLAAGADLEPLDGSDFESLVAESDDVQAQLDALVGRASDWTVVLTGWVEDREIREPLGAWLGTLEMSGSLEPPGALTPNPVPTGRMEETHPTPERADAAVVFHAPLAETQANREKLMLASRLLQTRATRALREEMGGTYHVDVWPIWLTAEAERRAGFEVQFATSPDRVDALTKRLREVVRELADADLDASVVGTVMHSMDRQTDRNLDYTYSELRAARLRGATFDPTRTFLKHTPLDVQELLHTVLTEHEVFEYRLVSESD